MYSTIITLPPIHSTIITLPPQHSTTISVTSLLSLPFPSHCPSFLPLSHTSRVSEVLLEAEFEEGGLEEVGETGVGGDEGVTVHLHTPSTPPVVHHQTPTQRHRLHNHVQRDVLA